MKQALRQLKSIPAVAEAMEHIDSYLASGYHSGEALLAHEFGNLISKKPVADAVANMRRNPNSIIYLLTQQDGIDETHIKVVSPYLFAARYTDKDGNVLLDEAAEIKEWLEADPQRSYQVITNSVLTSDNFFAQSVVDMDMAPRLLLTEELTAQWQGDREAGELNRELVDSAEWRELTQHPRMNVYETGRLDDALLGGDVNYGKLHAKYMISDQIGFLGTSNFDYRSRLYNNEMGFFFRSESLTEDFLIDFERLKSQSYRWGSPEWLQMRQKVSEVGGIKGVSTRYQQFLYRMLRATGLDWQF